MYLIDGDLSKENKEKMLGKHQCPECGMFRLEFYYPELTDDYDIIEQEIECQNCDFYLVMTSEVKSFRDTITTDLEICEKHGIKGDYEF